MCAIAGSIAEKLNLPAWKALDNADNSGNTSARM